MSGIYNFLYTVGNLIVVLSVLVFVHELGHYWAAKAFGVWVHRFSVGMGKPIKALSFQRGETEWAVSWLPLGGYVKMASREADPASAVLEGGASQSVPADRVFEAKPVWQRMIIILAGITMNLVFAWIVFTGLAWKNGRPYDPSTTIASIVEDSLPAGAADLKGLPSGSRIVSIDGVPIKTWDEVGERIGTGSRNEISFSFADGREVVLPLHRDALVERMQLLGALKPLHPVVFSQLTPGGPADEAGLEEGDSLVAINGESVLHWDWVVQRIERSAGVPMAFGIYRKGEPQTITITPKSESKQISSDSSITVGRIGAGGKSPNVAEPVGLIGAMGEGVKSSATAATAIFRTLRGLVNGRVSRKEVGGPILIGQMAARSARAGFQPWIAFMALISVNLAVVNLLPIPVLDGGAFVLLAIEGVIRRPLPLKMREWVSMFGLLLLVMLMVMALWNDIVRVFTG